MMSASHPHVGLSAVDSTDPLLPYLVLTHGAIPAKWDIAYWRQGHGARKTLPYKPTTAFFLCPQRRQPSVPSSYSSSSSSDTDSSSEGSDSNYRDELDKYQVDKWLRIGGKRLPQGLVPASEDEGEWFEVFCGTQEEYEAEGGDAAIDAAIADRAAAVADAVRAANARAADIAAANARVDYIAAIRAAARRFGLLEPEDDDSEDEVEVKRKGEEAAPPLVHPLIYGAKRPREEDEEDKAGAPIPMKRTCVAAGVQSKAGKSSIHFLHPSFSWRAC
jgi:hypothetical protein